MTEPTTTNGTSSVPGAPTDKKAARRKRFEDAWEIIRDELLQHFGKEGMPKDAQEWFKKNLDYNVPGGKLNRGMSVVDSVEILKGRTLSDDEYFKAAVLGWCVELLQAYFLVADDMMDGSITRRSQPCWYRVSSVGNIAINDAFMLEGAIYHLLKVHFRKEKCYVDLLEIFHETTYQTEMGQLIDLLTASEEVVDLSRFSLEKHRLIVIFKTAYYSFYLPVALAMFLCNIPESYVPTSPSSASASPPTPTPPREIHPYTLAKSILLPLGEYFQIQDDFLDFSAPPALLGKIGTDIVDNKCSWCINTALALADPAQRRILEENYGKKGVEGPEGGEAGGVEERRVKEVYEQVGLRDRYREYEEAAYTRIKGLVEEIPEGAGEGELRRGVFLGFLEKIYGRSK